MALRALHHDAENGLQHRLQLPAKAARHAVVRLRKELAPEAEPSIRGLARAVCADSHSAEVSLDGLP